MADLFDQPFSQALMQGIGMINQAIQYRNTLDLQRQELEMKKKQMDELDQYRTEKNKLEAEKNQLMLENATLKAGVKSPSAENAERTGLFKQAEETAIQTPIGSTPDEQKQFAQFQNIGIAHLEQEQIRLGQEIESKSRDPIISAMERSAIADPTKQSPLAEARKQLKLTTSALQARKMQVQNLIASLGPDAYKTAYGAFPNAQSPGLAIPVNPAPPPQTSPINAGAIANASMSIDAELEKVRAGGKADTGIIATGLNDARLKGNPAEVLRLVQKLKGIDTATRTEILKKAQAMSK